MGPIHPEPEPQSQLALDPPPTTAPYSLNYSGQNIYFPKTLPLTEQHKKFIFQRCRNYSFFSDLPEKQIEQLCGKFCICLSHDQWLLKEGSVASYFFVVAEGYVDVVKKGQFIRKLGPGECFGEMALLYGIKRSSSIRIVKQYRTKNIYFALHKTSFLQAIQYINPKTTTQVLTLMKSHSAFDYLTYRDKQALAQTAIKINFKNGQRILSKFDQPYCLFLLKSGKVRVHYPNKRQMDVEAPYLFGYYGSNLVECSVVAVGEACTYAISKEIIDRTLKNKIKFLYLLNKVKFMLLNHPRLQKLSCHRIEELTFLFSFKYIGKLQPLCLCQSQLNKILIPLSCVQNEEIQIIGIQELFTSKKKYQFDYIAKKSGHYAQINSQLFNRYISDQNFILDQQQFKSFNLNRSSILTTIPQTPHTPQHLICKQDRFNLPYTLQITPKTSTTAQNLRSKHHTLQSSTCLFIQNIYFLLEHNNELALAKEFIRGNTLWELMRGIGTLPYGIGRFYVACAVVALEGLHGMGGCCCGLGMGNFRVGVDGFLWLWEFQGRFFGVGGVQKGMQNKENKQDKENMNQLKELKQIQTRNKQNKKFPKPYKYFQQDFRNLGLLSYQLLVGQPYQPTQYPTQHPTPIKYPPTFKQKQAKQFLQALIHFQIQSQVQAYGQGQLQINRPKIARKPEILLHNQNIQNGLKYQNGNFVEFQGLVANKWGKIKEMGFFKGIDWKSLRNKQLQPPIIPGFMSLNPNKI